MNYQQAMEYIGDINNLGSVLGLENMKNLCEALGNPQRDINVVHIAGTNGKGSTGAFIDGILRNAGYTVARYVSPTILTYEERFQINGESISQKALADYMTRIKAAADVMVSKGMPQPTAFELETALSFLYFRDMKCDFVLLEVGMGGITDATNIIDNSVVSIITSISFDHTAVLGNSLEEIAEKKAGIIKNNGCVITSNTNVQVLNAIKKTAAEKNARITVSKPQNMDYINGIFDYGTVKDIKLSVKGVYQLENAALAVETALTLRKKGYNISDENIKKGIYNTKWQGRFHILSENPVFIVDGSHNIDGVKMLMESLELYYGNAKKIFIMGIFKDKDYSEMVKLVADKAKEIYTVTPPGNRCLNNEILKAEIEKYNRNVAAMELDKAVEKALKNKDCVCVAFGSLSFIGNIIKMF